MEPVRDPFDELTSLYLGEPSPPLSKSQVSSSSPSRRARIDPMRITVAVCGNLPVMAGIWVTQYADLEAAKCGPTVLVRLDGGRCSFELLRPEHDPARLDGEPMSHAARSMAADIRRWIICVDDRDAAAAVRAGADELVVLTSADQLALVEAYRLVKSARARAMSPDTLDLGVVIAGANEQMSTRAASVLEDMAARHLGAPLPIIAMVRRLDVVEHSRRIAFEESLRGDPSEVVAALRAVATSDVAPDQGVMPDEPTLRLRLPEHESEADLEGLLHHLGLDADDDLEMEIEANAERSEFDAIFGDDGEEAEQGASPPARPRRRIDSERQRPRVPAPIRLGPAPSQPSDRPAFIDLDDVARVDADAASRVGPGRGDGGHDRSAVETKPTSAASRPPVSSLVCDLVSAVAGLSPIDWPFVAASGVQGATDGDGRLHLLCRDVDHGQLDIARHWAVSHARQLAGFAGIAEEAVKTPVLHVVTDHAPRVTNLHRTGIHLHLVVEAAGGRISVPLNDDGNREMR
jgi:hypothetical protein